MEVPWSAQNYHLGLDHIQELTTITTTSSNLGTEVNVVKMGTFCGYVEKNNLQHG